MPIISGAITCLKILLQKCKSKAPAIKNFFQFKKFKLKNLKPNLLYDNTIVKSAKKKD